MPFTFISLPLASLRHYRSLHMLVIAGVAVAVAVLAGALLVGASVRASLRDLALARLGSTDLVLTSTSSFRDDLGGAIAGATFAASAPVIAVTGTLTNEDSRRTASRVQVFGIDDSFLALNRSDLGAPVGRDAWMSEALAAEIGAAPGASVLLRVAKPTDIPLSHLQGRREDVSERIRLTATRILGRESLGEFSLLPSQGPALSLFVPLSRLQQDLALGSRANGLLIRTATPDAPPEQTLENVRGAVARAARLDDLGLDVRTVGSGATRVLESRTGMLPDAVWRPAARAAEQAGRSTAAVLAYLANSVRARGREIPYSLIAAMDLTAYSQTTPSRSALPVPALVMSSTTSASALPAIWLNEWAVEDLGVHAGDQVEIDYFLWSDQDGLQTKTASFAFAGTVPMSGAGGDSTLTPEYPGITDAGDVTSWDPPFPVDMTRVRKKDEDYWDAWRAAPKAFVALEVGQRLWPSPFGTLSSLRTSGLDDWPPATALDPFQSGLTLRHARADALAAAQGTTDFGEYFIYFSFFIVAAGLLLAGLFFALSVEQRARELGVLLAIGFATRDVRRTLIVEAVILATIGAAIGIVAAIGYAAIIMYGLRTWWVDAVGTTALRLHVDPVLLVAGALGALGAAVIALAWSMRRIARRSARTLLSAGLADEPVREPGFGRAALISLLSIAAAAVLIAAALSGAVSQVAAFFVAGGLVMIAGCAAFAAWLRRRAPATPSAGVVRFGAAYARWRPTRSVLSAALIAFACFVIVSVGAFRRDPSGIVLTRESGTGGFVLMGESVAPLMHNPNTADGREELSLAGYQELERARIMRFRLRPGDEASCLTLYQPRNPRLVAPEAAFLAEGRFSFAQSIAQTDEERRNPWLLLNRRFDDGAVAAVADQTTLTYVFHLRVGDDFVFTPEGGAPVRLRIVGVLADSVLQSELIIGERDFVRLFPRNEGYRVWLIEAPEAEAAALTAVLEDRLSDFGMDLTDTRARLASYHQVENTYLATFQALGALGLLLGTLGLAAVLARNVLERRRELGLLAAVGFTPHHLRTLVTAESLMLVVTGLAIGAVAALVAIAPALGERGNAVPFGSLGILLLAVVATGIVSSLAAVRMATSVRVVEALKNE